MTRVPQRVARLLLPPFDVLNRKAAALRAAGHDVISLGQAVPGFGPPRAAIDAARAALDDAETHRYSADAGLVTLREALCEKLAAHRGVAVQADINEVRGHVFHERPFPGGVRHDECDLVSPEQGDEFRHAKGGMTNFQRMANRTS